MPTEVYAKKVVADLLKPKTSAWLWHGHQASVVRWLSWLMPRTFWVSWFAFLVAFWKLKNHVLLTCMKDNYFAKKFGLRKFKA